MQKSMNRAQRRRLERSGAPVRSSPLRLVALGVTLLLLLIVAAIAIVNRNAVTRSASEAPIYAPISVGQRAPAFAVTTIDGQSIDSRTTPEPVLLEVFATWCPHCRHETATLNELQRQLGTKLQIVAVSGSDVGGDHSSDETENDVRAFAQYFKVVYPIAFDPDLTVAKAYLQGGFPTIVFIDTAKRITAIETGEISLQRLTADARKAGVR